MTCCVVCKEALGGGPAVGPSFIYNLNQKTRSEGKLLLACCCLLKVFAFSQIISSISLAVEAGEKTHQMPIDSPIEISLEMPSMLALLHVLLLVVGDLLLCVQFSWFLDVPCKVQPSCPLLSSKGSRKIGLQ